MKSILYSYVPKENDRFRESGFTFQGIYVNNQFLGFGFDFNSFSWSMGQSSVKTMAATYTHSFRSLSITLSIRTYTDFDSQPIYHI
uniref:Uncharacterized protein n=1 Tax=Picea glauca TaxID=3330 RepID=A0A101LV23_PICGL|nr:hypothetical protein ABT39_MTgene2195 [Picea glauca]QHR87812.1 hypothetical protein Q903MT_gene1824 [Picea sitchensis]